MNGTFCLFEEISQMQENTVELSLRGLGDCEVASIYHHKIIYRFKNMNSNVHNNYIINP